MRPPPLHRHLLHEQRYAGTWTVNRAKGHNPALSSLLSSDLRCRPVIPGVIRSVGGPKATALLATQSANPLMLLGPRVDSEMKGTAAGAKAERRR